MLLSRRVFATAVTTLVLAACGSDTTDRVAGPGDLGHIHDLVETADGELLAASHSGLYRITDTETAILVGSEQHDLMSMAADDDLLYASGHPDLRLEKYRVADHPPHLGLARSGDGGETWTVEADLLGKHDFHALLPTSRGLYAADTQGMIRLRTPAAEWTDLGELAARDLAADPDNPDHLVATDEEAQIWVSTDGARTWSRVQDAPPVIEVEWEESDLLVAATEDGVLYRAGSPDGPWASVASAPGEIETLHIDDGRWWVTGHGGSIHFSTDDAATWEAVYLPPER
ncbi:MAG: hypothetical protein R8J94_14625 [Acidimicrobiia bacterium]|nr:hypothetical protein [Acidimicrobiia bacterium]